MSLIYPTYRIFYPRDSSKNNNRNIFSGVLTSINIFDLKGYGTMRIICPYCNESGPYLVYFSVKGPKMLVCAVCYGKHYDTNELIISTLMYPRGPIGTIYLKEPTF